MAMGLLPSVLDQRHEDGTTDEAEDGLLVQAHWIDAALVRGVNVKVTAGPPVFVVLLAMVNAPLVRVAPAALHMVVAVGV